MSLAYEVRTASISDVGYIEDLYNSDHSSYFGDKLEPPLMQLFYEYQTHRLIAYDSAKPRKILAYCEFCVYPNIAVLSNDCWTQWLKCRFCVDLPVSLMNTIFFNFYIQLKDHDRILKLVLQEVFYREHKVNYLIVVRPPNFAAKDFALLEQYGKIYYPIAFNIFTCKNWPTIIIITRSKFMPLLTFRKALPEDNDDVIEMIDVEEPEMRKKHGDYFIAEVLLGTAGGKMDKDLIIVSEESESPTIGSTGMMWLSDDANIEKLIKNFDLENLGNLVTCTPNVPHAVVNFEVFTAEQREYFNLKTDVILSKRRTIHLEENMLGTKDLNPIFTKFKYVTDELSNRSNYLDKVSKTLNIVFDLPERRSLIKNKKYNLSTASKAFILKNFILHPSIRLEYTYYFLCAMFSAYPNRDYCVIPIPAGTKYSVSLTALLNFFIRVRHRPSCEISDEIFVAHRSSISTELNVFPMLKEDIDDVTKLLGAKANAYYLSILEQVINDFRTNQRSEYKCWVVRCGNFGRENTTTVGFVIIRPFSNYEAVYKQFMLPHDENYLTYDRGEIIMLRLHPYFHMWSDEVFRTVAVRSGFRDLFYFDLVGEESLPNDLAIKMMPIEPRRMARNWFIDIESEECYRRSSNVVHFPKLNCVKDRYYLFRHNLFTSKFIGNQNHLVVVGFSDICKAFLRLMVFGWNTPDYKYVNVNNCLPMVDITVIVNYGEIEAEYDPNVKCSYCDSRDKCYLSNANSCPFVMDTVQRLDMRNWINFVSGTVEKIDRAEKNIALDNHCKIHYDKLILLCDTKFGLPAVKKMYNDVDPYNCVHINGRLDKIQLYHKLMELTHSKLEDKHIVVYGYTLALYECIDFLLKHNCNAEDIVYVQPHITQQSEYLNNPTIDKNLDNILSKMVVDLGIKVYESCNYSSYMLHKGVNFIETVSFKTFPNGKKFTLKCNLFVNFYENYLSVPLQKVIMNSDIRVHNKKILVDENYRTNDPHIYAAGKHVEILWDVFYQYDHVSESEMAQKLIDIMHLSQNPITIERRFSKPILFHALLPLDHMVIKITIPKRYLLGKLSNEYSPVMTTYNGDFFRVRMNGKGIVEEIVCVTRNLDKSLYFLEHFCGKHETMLNNIRMRWKSGLIKDFVSFFEHPWTEYIMHDRFNDMQARNHATIISLMNMHCNIQGMKVGDKDFQEASKHFLEANLLKFLRRHRKEFINKFPLPEDWEKPEEI